MFLFIFFQIVQASFEEIDCDILNQLLQRKYEIKKPIILMLYFKYGAIYQNIRSSWDIYSEQFPQFQFLQLDMKEYQDECIVGNFPHNQLPYGILINNKYEFHGELIRDAKQYEDYFYKPDKFQLQPLPEYNQYRKLFNMLTHYIFIQSIKAVGILIFIIFVIILRLSIYKDKEKEKEE